jgi:hypothetical protein
MDHYENYCDYREDAKITDNCGNVQNEGHGSGATIAILIAVGIMLLIWATGSVQLSPYTPSTTTSEAPIAPVPTLPIPSAEPKT